MSMIRLLDLAVFCLLPASTLRTSMGCRIVGVLNLYGQEINPSAFAMAKINMFLHFLEDARIEREDVLAEPKFVEKGALQSV